MSLDFFFLKGWDPKCPFNLEEISHKLDCVALWKRKKEDREAIIWNPPPKDILNWNVDWPSRGKPGPVGIGGVL